MSTLSSGQAPDYFQVAKRLLDAPELSLGNQSVRRVSSATTQEESLGGFPGPYAWYTLETRPLELGAVRESLLLFAESPSLKEIRDAWEIVMGSGKSSQLICVVPEAAQCLGADSPQGVVVWSARDLFDHILQLPLDFVTRLRSIAAIQRSTEFTVAFQERRARLSGLAFVPGSDPVKDVSSYFRQWLGAHRRVSPILLLGERGLGKSWLSLRLAHEAYELNRAEPWLYGPAFFIKLRELVNVLEKSSAATPVILQYILTRYPGIGLGPGGPASLGALMGIGHTVVCVDGFDEMDLLPTDARVRARLTELLMLLSRKTRFILSCRPGHFTSLEALLSADSWSGVTVGQAFEVLELLPYDDTRGWAYIDTTAPEIWPALSGLLGSADARSALQHALWVCARHPGLLARLRDQIKGGITTPRRLIEDAINSILIEFNLAEGRTRRDYQAANGTWVDLSAPRRSEVLADIAWYLAERRIEALDLSNLPPRISLSYQIQDDALQRDLRSQTVLELAPLEPTEELNVPTQRPSALRKPGRGSGSTTTSAVPKSLVRFTLRDEAWDRSEPGEASVAWAYFLAQHVVARMTEAGPLGMKPTDVSLRHLGRIPFGPTVAALVKDSLADKGIGDSDLRRLGWNFLRSLARNRIFQIFSPWYRYLAANLAAMQAIDRFDATRLDPWSPEVSLILKPPQAVPDYRLAIVPPVNYEVSLDPFLLGVHEVTNSEFLAFVEHDGQETEDSSVHGREWAVERMTVAAGGGGELSANYVLSNEYHLFFWLPPKDDFPNAEEGKGKEFRPPPRILGQPVTYVSWFAAAAYCDWLSITENMPRFYRHALLSGLGRDAPQTGENSETRYAFRLPTKEQWIWAARAGHDDVDRAWELYPYHLSRDLRVKLARGGPEVSDDHAAQEYLKAQRVMRAILLDPYKQSGDVVHDEANDFGIAGLIGNVREWCDSLHGGNRGVNNSGAEQRLILGATGYLGEGTFNFRYEAPLYPRNTNPDVGFRIARSLNPEEVRILRDRQEAIGDMPEAT